MAARTLCTRHTKTIRSLLCSSFSTSVSATKPKNLGLPDTKFSHFLINESGFTETEIIALVKRFKGYFQYKALFKCEKAFELMGIMGLSNKQICELLIKPNIAKDASDFHTMAPKVRQIKSLGLTQESLFNILNKNPSIFSTEIDPQISNLRTVFGGKEMLAKALEECPELLLTSIQNNVVPCLQALNHCGLKGKHLTMFLQANPEALTLVTDKLKKKIESIRVLGDAQDLKGFLKILTKPKIFNSKFMAARMGRNQPPSMENIRDAFGGNENVLRAIEKHPKVFSVSNLSNVAVLSECGIEGGRLHYLLKINPSVMMFKPGTLREKIRIVQGFGIEESSPTFLRALGKICRNGADTIEEKFKCLESFGLPRRDVNEVVRKCPEILTVSYEKLQRNMKFLVNTAGCKCDIVVSSPTLLLRSFEKTLWPRYLVSKYLREVEPSKWCPGPGMQSLAIITEDKFLQRYVTSSPYTSELMKIYQDAISQPEPLPKDSH